MLFFNVIKMSFTDLSKISYKKEFSYNEDMSGFVYASEKEKHELVFYPVNKSVSIENISADLAEQLWRKNLFFNILPFPITMIFVLLIEYILQPFDWQIQLASALFIFVFVLYLAKYSLSIIGTVMSYRLLSTEDFRILPLYPGLGDNSTIEDEVRARVITSPMKTMPYNNSSEILANSHFIEKRLYEEKNVIDDRNDSRGPVSVDLNTK